jgi:hypothetical protein
MAVKKYIAMWLGVTFDYQATDWKQGGLPVKAPLPCCTPIGCLGVIYNSQLAGMHKTTNINRWKHLHFD